MKEAAIPLQKAQGALSEWVRRARLEQTTFLVVDEAQTVARLVPSGVQSCTGAELARVIDNVRLSSAEAAEWSADLRAARERLLPPEDRWQ